MQTTNVKVNHTARFALLVSAALLLVAGVSWLLISQLTGNNGQADRALTNNAANAATNNQSQLSSDLSNASGVEPTNEPQSAAAPATQTVVLPQAEELCYTAPFVDVPADMVACPAIQWAVQNKVVEGYTDGTFRPGTLVNRQQMSAFLYRLVNHTTVAPACTQKPANDIPINSPFCGTITWAINNGIMVGNADQKGNFLPKVYVNRGGMTLYMYIITNRTDENPQPRLAPCERGEKPFTDINSDSYNCPYIAWAVDSGIANGYTDGSFHPNDLTTRGQMVMFLKRTAALLPQQ